ncbi:MAG: 50S ribosomal protein L15e [Nanoarchaeota archaeon]
MGVYKYIREIWKKPNEKLAEINKQRLIEWRADPVTKRIDYPTRLDRARSLGYKAKPGYIIIRQRVKRGGRQRPKFKGGRRPRHMSRRKDLKMSYQWIAESRSEKKYVNCTALNSYNVGKDKDYYYYEVILVDRANPHIVADKNINWICDKRGRAQRGLTSSARKSRGLLGKGKGYEKMRPSLRANKRLAR